MSKFIICLELDDEGKETGKFQVAEEEDDYVIETFDTEEEAETYIKVLQEDEERNEKIRAEYLEWEKACLTRHYITQENLRVFLCNVVLI
jgi:hypothetical protein